MKKVKMKVKADDLFDVVKASVLSVLIAVVLVLVFALIVKFTHISDKVIAPVNIAIKTVSIFFGCLIGIKSASKGALKGAVVGVIFMLSTFLLFSLISGSFTANPLTIIDVVLMIIEGLVSGIFAVNIKGRKA